MDKKRVHIIVLGKVQGVFFRASTKDTADNLELSGFVRNKSDGTVEVIAEGDRGQLQKLVDWCHIGPDRSIVSGVEVDWSPYTAEFQEFNIH